MGNSTAIRNSLSKHYEFSVDTRETEGKKGYICTLDSDDYGNLTLTSEDKTEVINIELFAKEIYTVSSYKSNEQSNSRMNIQIFFSNIDGVERAHLYFQSIIKTGNSIAMDGKKYKCSLSGFLNITNNNIDTPRNPPATFYYKYNETYALKKMSLQSEKLDIASIKNTVYYSGLKFTEDATGKSEVDIHAINPAGEHSGEVTSAKGEHSIDFLNDSTIFVETVKIYNDIINGVRDGSQNDRNLNLKADTVYLKSIETNNWKITSPADHTIVFKHKE